MNHFSMMFVIAAVCTIQSVVAQSSVYVCAETGAYGWGTDNNNVATHARNNYIAYGDTSCYSVASTNSKGYGAKAIVKTNSEGQAVGAGIGYSSAKEAQSRAFRECGKGRPSVLCGRTISGPLTR